MGRRIKLSVDDERLGGVEIRHLAALAAVAGEGSLKGAARRLGYVQSTVSRQLAEVEHAVDARLVERLPGAGGVRLTDAGRLLLGHAESILGRIIPRTPILARSRIPSFSPTHVSSWCPPARPYPSARVLLAPGDRSAATHPADRLPPQQRVDAALAAHGGPMRVTQSVTSDGGVRALVASGVGVAVLPRMSVDTADPDTVAVELGDELPPRRLVLAWNRERRPHPDGQRFRHAVNNGCERLGASACSCNEPIPTPLSPIRIAYALRGADTGPAVKLVGLVSGALIGLLVAAAPALGVIYYPMKAEQTVRIAPSTIADAMGTVWNGELVEIHCQDRGSSVGGSTLWDYIQYNVDGTGGLKKRGWVPDYYVKTGTTEPLPHVRQGDCPPPQTTPGPAVDPPPLRSAPPSGPSPPTPTPAPGPGPAPEPAPQPACGPAPAVGGHQLHVAIPRRRPVKAITTRYGRPVEIRGSLATPTGAPVAGAPICIAARNVDSRAVLRATRYIVTDAQGRFTYRLESGPSRRIWFVHGSDQGAVADSVLVRVRASVSLRGSSNSLRTGQTLVMRGRLRGRPRRRGVLVELQARRPTGWQTFGTTSTASSGRFSYAYRFTRTVGVEHYLLRARVRAQPSHYPYATGASRPLRVRVVG